MAGEEANRTLIAADVPPAGRPGDDILPRRPAVRKAERTTGAAAWGDFRRFWAAHSVSIFGDQLTLVALPLAAYAQTESALAVGLVASLEGFTALALGLVAGAIADRRRHRHVLVTTDLGRAVALLLLAATVTATDALWPILAGAVLLGLLRVLHDAAAAAVLPVVVAGPDLLAANGRMQASEGAGTGAGPALAGGLISLGGLALAFVVDAVTFVASALTVGRIRRIDEAADPAAAPSSIRADVAEGVRALLADRPMVHVVVVTAALNVQAAALEAHFIPFARQVLDIGALGIGIFFAIGGSAAVATSLVLDRRRTSRGDAVLLGLAAMAAGVLLAGALPSFVTVTVAYLAAGMGSTLVVSHAYALRQRRFPIRLQGRVTMVVRTAFLGTFALAFLVGGFVSEELGPEALFVGTGAIGFVAVVYGIVAGVARLRED